MATGGISYSRRPPGGMAGTLPSLTSGSCFSRRRAIQLLAFVSGYLGLGSLGKASRSFALHPSAPPVSRPGIEPISFKFELVRVDAGGRIVARKPGQARGFSQAIGDSLLEMVALPSGQLTVAGAATDTQGLAQPRPPVTLAAFSMGRYPVTQAQWRAVAALPRVKLDLAPAPFGFKGDNRPAEGVSWYDAMEFCARLSLYSGQPYTLPSEAQWEYACRAGTTTPFHVGETITTDLANYHGHYPYGLAPPGPYRALTTEVDRFPANGFGLYDMHGNVWEWCLDPYPLGNRGAARSDSPWAIGTAGEARSPALPIVQGHSWRVLRGGSWFDGSSHCGCAHRTFLDPLGRNYFGGFRVVSDLPRAL